MLLKASQKCHEGWINFHWQSILEIFVEHQEECVTEICSLTKI